MTAEAVPILNKINTAYATSATEINTDKKLENLEIPIVRPKQISLVPKVLN